MKKLRGETSTQKLCPEKELLISFDHRSLNDYYPSDHSTSLMLHFFHGSVVETYNCQSPAFALNIVICNSFLINLRNELFLCCERNHVGMDKQSALFFLLRAYRTKISILQIFPVFSKCWYMIDCDMFNIIANSCVLSHALFFTNDIRTSLSKSDGCLGLGSYLPTTFFIPKEILQISDLLFSCKHLTINTIYLSRFLHSVISFLKPP